MAGSSWPGGERTRQRGVLRHGAAPRLPQHGEGLLVRQVRLCGAEKGVRHSARTRRLARLASGQVHGAQVLQVAAVHEPRRLQLLRTGVSSCGGLSVRQARTARTEGGTASVHVAIR